MICDTRANGSALPLSSSRFTTLSTTRILVTLPLTSFWSGSKPWTFFPISDAADPSQARLFTEIDFTEVPETGRDAMAAQLVKLHLRLFADPIALDGQEVEANLRLWSDLYAVNSDPLRSWAGVLSALLRDPDFLFY